VEQGCAARVNGAVRGVLCWGIRSWCGEVVRGLRWDPASWMGGAREPKYKYSAGLCVSLREDDSFWVEHGKKGGGEYKRQMLRVRHVGRPRTDQNRGTPYNTGLDGTVLASVSSILYSNRTTTTDLVIDTLSYSCCTRSPPL
jgi:hypothetical protein